jgi:putative membrane protein insertion efficiency factor
MTEPSNAAAPHAGVPPVGVAAAGVLALLRAYKLLLSPLFAGSCRFEPSCSAYMADAVRIHGALMGTWLGIRRLVRCVPFGGYGIDPVPHRR